MEATRALISEKHMQWRNTASRYGFVASSLHWLIAAGIVAQYFLAEAADDSAATTAGALSAASLHTSLGITLLALAALRIIWRLIELPPERPTAMKGYEIAIARATHIAFYVLLFAIPLSGWALATVDGQSPSYFGPFELPQLRLGAQLGTLDKEQLEEIHEILFNILLTLAVLHIAAALKHHFFDRDGVLRSMLPWRNPGA
jgi:cytochrome b561